MKKAWKVTLEQNLKKQYVYASAMSARGAELEAKKTYPNATIFSVERQIAQKRATRQPEKLDKIDKQKFRYRKENITTPEYQYAIITRIPLEKLPCTDEDWELVATTWDGKRFLHV